MSNKLLVGRYELIEKIGEGGMAVVYKAKDRFLNRFVAIKILRPEYTKDSQFVESFRKESQAAAGLQHPNIISVYDVGREGNIHFIVMELVDGRTLSNVIKDEAPLDYKRSIEITKQVASALSLAHRNNIIHRDIKPHNILITNDGMAKLGDFGIAKAVSDSTLTETSKIIGSVHYFSPEQARGAYVDERSDIYSLGIVLYEMLTGRVPFDGENPVQVALMHINDTIVPPTRYVASIPPALEKLVMKATDKFQANRYKSADELLEDLSNIEFVTKMVGDTIYAASDVEDFRKENQRKAQGQMQQQDPPVKKKSRKPLIIAMVILLLILGTLGAMAVTGFFTDVGKVVVEDVTDLEYSEAKDILEEQGLKVEKGDRVTSDTIEKGRVAKQEPGAKTKVDKGAVVTLHLSAGKATGAVPSLVGKYYDKAEIKALLNSKGFDLGEVKKQKSDDYDTQQIISQDPTGEAVVEQGTKVNIVVCSGPKTIKVKVPSLTGLNYDKAVKKLTKAGLEPGAVDYEESTAYEEGTVIWQQYDPGTELEENATVNLKVSKGAPEPEPEPVPEEDSTDTDDSGGGSDSGSGTSGDVEQPTESDT